jgi:hypothetical protein
MSRRRSNRKPNRFSRTSKRRGGLKRYKLRGGTREDEIQKISAFSIEFKNLRDTSNIIGIKAEIAEMLKMPAMPTDIDRKYEDYTLALRELIRQSIDLAMIRYVHDSEVTNLKAQVDELMLVATPVNAKYYDLSDVYDTIGDFFAKRAINLMSSDVATSHNISHLKPKTLEYIQKRRNILF